MCAYTLSHLHHPSPHTNILASLVKGEVLSPEKIRATTGGIALHPPNLSIPTTFSKAHQPLRPVLNLPPLSKVRCCRPKELGDYRRDCSLSAPTLPNPHYPLPRTMSLPPLSKVRCCRPKKFGRLPEGLLPIRTNPPKTAPSLENRHHPFASH